MSWGLILAGPVAANEIPGGGGDTAPNTGPGTGETQDGPEEVGPSTVDRPVIPPYGLNLDGPLSERLQALAFGIGAFDPVTGLVTVQRVTGSWFQIDRATGAFTLVTPGCAGGTGTITTTWNGDELTVTIVGTMCNLEGDLTTVNTQLVFLIGPKAGEVRFQLEGSSDLIYRNLGRVLIETDAFGSWVRPIDQPVQPLGEWDDLLGMAAVMVATHDGQDIYHPSYEPPPPGGGGQANFSCWTSSPEIDQCVSDCEAYYADQVAAAQQQLANAIQFLADETSAARAQYNTTVALARQDRDSCLAWVKAYIASAGIVTAVGGTASLVVPHLRVAAAVIKIAVTTGAVAIEGLTGKMLLDGCEDDYYWRVRAAHALRKARIEAAEHGVEVAEENLQWWLAEESTCMEDCCPPIPEG